MERLCVATLARLPPGVRRPAYDLDAVTPGILHLGAGAFHRAHQAVVTDSVLASGALNWGITAANLRSSTLRDALTPQDGLYAVEESGVDGRALQVIGALRSCIAAQDDPAALIAAMADPRIRIVSLTVTEKGYCLDAASGGLDEDHGDVRHDLANPQAPRGALGFLSAALARRRAAGIAPFSVLSCDNLAGNGPALKRTLTRFATLSDRDFGSYLADAVACPATMVDRIVPAATADDAARIAAALGLTDAAPLVCENFLQWIIEDDFPLGRPDWDRFGAAFVTDAKPWEAMKLRLLNGAHSAIAYLGLLSGKATMADAMAGPALARFAEAMMSREIAPTLPPPPGANLPAYIGALLKRFANPYLRHRLAQIAMDGSQKLPQRLLPSVRSRLAASAPFPHLAISIAAWMRFVAQSASAAPALQDPLAEELCRRARAAGPNAAALTQALAGVAAVFGEELPRDPRFTGAVAAALDQLSRLGVEGALAQLEAAAP